VGLSAHLWNGVTVREVVEGLNEESGVRQLTRALADSKHLKITAIIVILLAPEWAFGRVPGFGFSLFWFQLVMHCGICGGLQSRPACF